MNKKIVIPFAFLFSIAACNNNKNPYDASGTFEVDEVIVSAEISGKIISLNVQEGDTLGKGKVVGTIDAKDLSLQKDQVQASIKALDEKKADVIPQEKLLKDQLAVQQSQLQYLLHEKTRFENLLKQDAATGKQVDDINSQIEVARKQIAVTQQQMAVQRNNISTQNRSVMSEAAPLEKKVAQLNDQIQKSNIVNPISGTVITKYVQQGEFATTGKALYKIAGLSEMTLRAYITGAQLPQVQLGQNVKVLVDNGAKKYKEFDGVISWISDKAEFTPKTIQTKDERANLVYAIKIKVKNDGYLKIGMYGEVELNPKS